MRAATATIWYVCAYCGRPAEFVPLAVPPHTGVRHSDPTDPSDPTLCRPDMDVHVGDVRCVHPTHGDR